VILNGISNRKRKFGIPGIGVDSGNNVLNPCLRVLSILFYEGLRIKGYRLRNC
jgi:hypothetical protein